MVVMHTKNSIRAISLWQDYPCTLFIERPCDKHKLTNNKLFSRLSLFLFARCCLGLCVPVVSQVVPKFLGIPESKFGASLYGLVPVVSPQKLLEPLLRAMTQKIHARLDMAEMPQESLRWRALLST